MQLISKMTTVWKRSPDRRQCETIYDYNCTNREQNGSKTLTLNLDVTDSHDRVKTGGQVAMIM